jgi:hypothetical protein
MKAKNLLIGSKKNPNSLDGFLMICLERETVGRCYAELCTCPSAVSLAIITYVITAIIKLHSK